MLVNDYTNEATMINITVHVKVNSMGNVTAHLVSNPFYYKADQITGIGN